MKKGYIFLGENVFEEYHYAQDDWLIDTVNPVTIYNINGDPLARGKTFEECLSKLDIDFVIHLRQAGRAASPDEDRRGDPDDPRAVAILSTETVLDPRMGCRQWTKEDV